MAILRQNILKKPLINLQNDFLRQNYDNTKTAILGSALRASVDINGSYVNFEDILYNKYINWRSYK
jgi:hypothetical protein